MVPDAGRRFTVSHFADSLPLSQSLGDVGYCGARQSETEKQAQAAARLQPGLNLAARWVVDQAVLCVARLLTSTAVTAVIGPEAQVSGNLIANLPARAARESL